MVPHRDCESVITYQSREIVNPHRVHDEWGPRLSVIYFGLVHSKLDVRVVRTNLSGSGASKADEHST